MLCAAEGVERFHAYRPAAPAVGVCAIGGDFQVLPKECLSEMGPNRSAVPVGVF
jgi:hypothetical protein